METSKDILSKIYRLYSWGAEDKPELLNESNRLSHQANSLGHYEEVERVIKLGKKAYGLLKHLESLLEQQGYEAAKSWVVSEQKNLPGRINNSLNLQLKRWQERQEQLKTRREAKVHKSSLTPVIFEKHHPNSLRHLSPDSQWTIYIDETGQHFDYLSEEDTLPSQQIGRVVALAVPACTTLLPISGGFHATEASVEEVDATLEYLLRQEVGILGFSVNDPVAQAANWFSHVVLLARWVLLQLPIYVGESTQVAFVIERNDARLAYQSIDSLANLLEGILKGIDPVRFDKLQITAELMDKQHPMNAYVDVIAYTWGSPSSASKDRLKKSALQGHCLLRPDYQSMDRLYLSVAKNTKLLSADWFDLCTAATQDVDSGLLAQYLRQLGEQTQKNFTTWQYYLDEVRSRMRHKDYRLSEISNALNWLETYTPEGEELPAIYRLPLETSRLGHENHLGKVNFARLETCIALINQLEEEDAQQACGALLRVLVSASNNFQFAILQPLLDEWLDKPIAVSGLANYARLHSSKGQIYAFCHQPREAIKHFEQAMGLLDRLSDKQRAQREKQQTNTYRQICLMDEGSIRAQALLYELAGSEDIQGFSRRIAASGQNARYAQHLWLRALISFPEDGVDARTAYLMHPHQWQSGEDHPWGLINAYRAWLLLLDGQEEHANAYMSSAVSICADRKNGPILWWIAEVLRTLAQALGLDAVEKTSSDRRIELKAILSEAPHNQLVAFAEEGVIKEHHKVLHYLQQCLPFNFH